MQWKFIRDSISWKAYSEVPSFTRTVNKWVITLSTGDGLFHVVSMPDSDEVKKIPAEKLHSSSLQQLKDRCETWEFYALREILNV